MTTHEQFDDTSDFDPCGCFTSITTSKPHATPAHDDVANTKENTMTNFTSMFDDFVDDSGGFRDTFPRRQVAFFFRAFSGFFRAFSGFFRAFFGLFRVAFELFHGFRFLPFFRALFVFFGRFNGKGSFKLGTTKGGGTTRADSPAPVRPSARS